MKTFFYWIAVAAVVAFVSLTFAPRYELSIVGNQDNISGPGDPTTVDRFADWKVVGLHRARITSRIFAAPDQFPPEKFKAYGIVAFPDRLTLENSERHEMMCEAFLDTVPHFTEVGAVRDVQFVTVWPIQKPNEAQQANRVARSKTCPIAVSNYGLALSHEMINAARQSGQDIPTDRGPFLLAWAPGSSVGDPDSIVLFRDLSHVTTVRAAKDSFSEWIDAIQKSPAIWNDIHWWKKFRAFFRNPADRYGGQILEALPKVREILGWGKEESKDG